MNSVEMVKKLCKERNVPISKLEKDLGFSNGYIRTLKKGIFPSDRLRKIADYLNVSKDFLSGEDEKPDSYQRITEEVAFEGYLNAIGWKVTRTDYAKGKPCSACIEHVTSNPTAEKPFGSGEQFCEHCLLHDNHYIFSNKYISVNVEDDDYKALASDVRALCIKRIKEYIANSFTVEEEYVNAAHDGNHLMATAAHDINTPIGDEDKDIDMIGNDPTGE